MKTALIPVLQKFTTPPHYGAFISHGGMGEGMLEQLNQGWTFEPLSYGYAFEV